MQAGPAGHRGLVLELVGYAFYQLKSNFAMGHFTTAEKQRNFDFIALLEKFNYVVDFNLVVVLIDVGVKLDLFDLMSRLLTLLFLFALALLILVFTIIHEAANRGIGVV